MKITDEAKARQLTVYLPDTRGVTISPFGVGNLKIGLGVYTYSRLPGKTGGRALGLTENQFERGAGVSDGIVTTLGGTCLGATKECQAICYAARPVTEDGPVFEMWAKNSATEDVPMALPPDCTILRLHISGDFTSRGYVDGWFALLAGRPDVTVWVYTRSWRVPSLLPALERLRGLPNVQMFASVDSTTPTIELERIAGWRRAWIDGDDRAHKGTYAELRDARARSHDGIVRNRRTLDGVMTLVCPEETGDKANCVECRYCFDGQKNDVTFLKRIIYLTKAFR